MIAFTFKVSGFQGIEDALGRIKSVRTKKKKLKDALIDAAQPMAFVAQTLAPMSASKGGNGRKLKTTIGVSDKLNRSQRKNASKNENEVVVYVGPYGHIKGQSEEFGYQGRAPRPYMTPAFDQTATEVIDRIAKNLRPIIIDDEIKQNRASKRGK